MKPSRPRPGPSQPTSPTSPSTPSAPTMKAVAAAAGVHPSTVSLALREDPRLPEETRRRVQASAQALGYRPNPLVAAWVSSKRSGRPVDKHLSLAFLLSPTLDRAWYRSTHYQTILAGARERCAEHGYKLTEFDLRAFPGGSGGLDRVLRARNIHGVIFGPDVRQYAVEHLWWEHYSLVCIGYALRGPVVHRVTEDHYLGMRMAFETARQAGWERIGFALLDPHNPDRLERWLGAYLTRTSLLPRRLQVPPLRPAQTGESAALDRWLQRHRPEVVLSDEPALWRARGVPVLGFALSDTGGPESGVRENNREIGRGAADLLVGMLNRNERGLPAVRRTLLVEPQPGPAPTARVPAVPRAAAARGG